MARQMMRDQSPSVVAGARENIVAGSSMLSRMRNPPCTTMRNSHPIRPGRRNASGAPDSSKARARSTFEAHQGAPGAVELPEFELHFISRQNESSLPAANICGAFANRSQRLARN